MGGAAHRGPHWYARAGPWAFARAARIKSKKQIGRGHIAYSYIYQNKIVIINS